LRERAQLGGDRGGGGAEAPPVHALAVSVEDLDATAAEALARAVGDGVDQPDVGARGAQVPGEAEQERRLLPLRPVEAGVVHRRVDQENPVRRCGQSRLGVARGAAGGRRAGHSPSALASCGVVVRHRDRTTNRAYARALACGRPGGGPAARDPPPVESDAFARALVRILFWSTPNRYAMPLVWLLWAFRMLLSRYCVCIFA